MKKIIIIALSLLLLTSCGENINNDTIKSEVKDNITVDEAVIETISFSDLENNLAKLRDLKINSGDLDLLNSEIKNIYNNFIVREAKTTLNISTCEKLDKSNIETCKKEVIVESGKIESCDNLVDSYSILECKNTIIKKEAYNKLDESICEKLILPEQEIVEIAEDSVLDIEVNDEANNCKNSILEAKATKNSDLNICKKISNKEGIGMCEELVRMEIENKRLNEEIQKQNKLSNPKEETQIKESSEISENVLLDNNPEF